MRSLAVVTMFFLPGTFVSSLLSIPLFDFNNTDAPAMYRQSFWGPRLTLYLAITVPLMLLTFAVWGLWLYVRHVRSRRRMEVVRIQLNQESSNQTELDELTRKKTAAHSS